MTLDDAIALTVKHFAGKRDKLGHLAVLHPLDVLVRVTRRHRDDALARVAVLHDIVEDTDVTLGLLRELGLNVYETHAVDLLTRPKQQPYKDYIESLMGDRVACLVKIHDLDANLSRNHLLTDPKERASLGDRYTKAIRCLTEYAVFRSFAKPKELEHLARW